MTIFVISPKNIIHLNVDNDSGEIHIPQLNKDIWKRSFNLCFIIEKFVASLENPIEGCGSPDLEKLFKDDRKEYDRLFFNSIQNVLNYIEETPNLIEDKGNGELIFIEKIDDKIHNQLENNQKQDIDIEIEKYTKDNRSSFIEERKNIENHEEKIDDNLHVQKINEEPSEKEKIIDSSEKSLNEANKDQIKLKEDLTVDTVELTLKESSENKKENNEVENKDYQGKLNEEASEKEKKIERRS